ncbi:MAG: thioredoxin [Acidobacteriota bacterium]|jgi:thioredoxin 2
MTEEMISCAKCGTMNRVKAENGTKVPVCGNCRTALPWLVHGTDASFNTDIEAPVPVLVDFWAEWCGPCRMVGPVLEELSRDLAGKLKIVKLNVDENQGIAGAFQIQSIPTLVLFKEGQPVDGIVGAMPKAALVAKLSPHLAN